MDYQLDSGKALSYGSLPAILTESKKFDKEQLLLTYGATYLKEEIQAESLSRNLEGFARFLSVVASRCTEFVDMAKFCSEAMINRESARRYFEILEDTLVLETVPAFGKSSRRRLVRHPRFFCFDNGVLNGLLESFELPADRKGRLFENLLLTQVLNGARSLAKPIEVSSYRTEHGAEVDFIVKIDGLVWAIEAKTSENIRRIDTRGFQSFSEYYSKRHEKVIATLGTTESSFEGIRILPWQNLLREMGL
jgi:predicted AAA+ superfamily ATPase